MSESSVHCCLRKALHTTQRCWPFTLRMKIQPASPSQRDLPVLLNLVPGSASKRLCELYKLKQPIYISTPMSLWNCVLRFPFHFNAFSVWSNAWRCTNGINLYTASIVWLLLISWKTLTINCINLKTMFDIRRFTSILYPIWIPILFFS